MALRKRKAADKAHKCTKISTIATAVTNVRKIVASSRSADLNLLEVIYSLAF
jgi:hypothetical protein